MRRLMTGYRNQQSAGVPILHPNFKRAASLLAVASVLGLGTVVAEEPAAAGNKSSTKGSAAQATAGTETAAIPECLTKLRLSSQQEGQIKEIMQKYDGSLATVWKQFGSRYMQAIAMETSLLAAIEDNLTEEQRTQVRAQRHKTAHNEKAVEATNQKPNQSTTKPASAVEDDLAGVGFTLTSEQETAADKVQEKYKSQLRSLKRDIEGMHIRLVSLEADKLVAIEKILTKDQLAELRAHRQNAPDAPRVATNRTESVKQE